MRHVSKPIAIYRCDFPDCDRQFMASGHLARHRRVHTGERRFACLYEGCDGRFSRKDNMMQHYRTHFGIRVRRPKKIRDGLVDDDYDYEREQRRKRIVDAIAAETAARRRQAEQSRVVAEQRRALLGLANVQPMARDGLVQVRGFDTMVVHSRQTDSMARLRPVCPSALFETRINSSNSNTGEQSSPSPRLVQYVSPTIECQRSLAGLHLPSPRTPQTAHYQSDMMMAMADVSERRRNAEYRYSPYESMSERSTHAGYAADALYLRPSPPVVSAIPSPTHSNYDQRLRSSSPGSPLYGASHQRSPMLPGTDSLSLPYASKRPLVLPLPSTFSRPPTPPTACHGRSLSDPFRYAAVHAGSLSPPHMSNERVLLPPLRAHSVPRPQDPFASAPLMHPH